MRVTSENVDRLKLKNEQLIAVRKKQTTSVPIHTHDYFELEVVLSGEGEHVLNGVSYPISRGSVFFLTPIDCHIIKLKNRVCLWNTSFRHSVLSEELLNKVYKTKQNHFQVDDIVLSKLEACSILLEKECKTTGKVQPLIEYALSLILPESNHEKTTPLENAMLYARTHFRENPTVEDASKIACLSSVYFGNVFKKTYGVSFTEYVNSQKVEWAKVLLSNGMSVSEACYESGFNSLSNFLKVFKLQTGVSPKEFKK